MARRRWLLMRVLLAATMVFGTVSVMPATAAIGGLVWERPSDPGFGPFDVVVDSDGSYYVACPGSASVEKFASDGTHVWTVDVSARFESYAGHVDVDETGVYINIEHGSVAKIDKNTGTTIWTASGIPGGMRVVTDVAAYEGVVYATQPGAIDSWFTLDASTGAYIGQVGYSTPHTEDAFYYVEADDTGIYVWTNDGMLHRLNHELGVVWEVALPGAGGMVLDGAGYLYVPNDNDGIVHKISVDDGSIVATLYGQDGCVGVGYLDDLLYTTSSSGDVVRTYAEPWPDPTAPQDVTGLESPSHPDSDQWYADDTPGFVWDYDPALLYSWSIDQDPEGTPDLTADPVAAAGVSVLGAPATYPAPWNPQSIAVGDFDEDGEMDFAAGIDDDSYGVTIYLNKGGGLFETDNDALGDCSYAEDVYAYDLQVGDIDGDGHLDIAFYLGSASSLGVIWGNGDGTFSDMSEYPTMSEDSPTGLAIADLDDLAGLDIAMNTSGSNGIEVWLSSSENPRQFIKTWVPLPADHYGHRAICAEDLNEDSYADLIISTDAGTLLVAINNGSGGFDAEGMSVAATATDGESVRMIRTADFNNDGYADVAAFSSETQRVFLGAGDGSLSESFDVTSYLDDIGAYGLPRAFAVGDFDGDDIPDLAFGDDDEYVVYALLGLGDGTFQEAGSTEVSSMRSSGRGIGSADFDGDGDDDVAIAGDGELNVLMAAAPAEFNVLSDALEDGTWYFHVREVNEKDAEWRGGATATVKVNIGEGGAAATKTIDNGTLMLTVSPNGTPEVSVDQDGPSGPMGWVYQYYGEDAWGSVLWFDDGGSSFSSGYVSPAGEGAEFTPVSNSVEEIAGGKRIVTVLDVGGTGVQVTQTFTLMDGDRFFTKTWSIENTGENDYSGLSFYHGGDTYFGGEDSASSYHDPAKSMVYVRNNEFMDWGIMGFYANPGTPATHYFSGSYSEGNEYAEDGEDLPDTADSDFQDAGYYLQWDRSTLNAGQRWDILAYELWTPGGPIQLLAPGPQNVTAGSSVVLPFTVQNLSEVPQDITLAASADDPLWTAEILGDATPSIGAVDRTEVLVKVEVPEGATGTVAISLEADGAELDAPVEAATTLSVLDLDISTSPTAVDLGAGLGEWVWKTVTVTNNSGAPVTFGAPSVGEPFGLGEHELTGATLADGESAQIPVGFYSEEAGDFTGVLNVPVVAPEIVSLTVALTGTASAAAPVPVYRFYSPASRAHFYTFSAAERDAVQDRLGSYWQYEGVAFEVDLSADTTPLYRFYNKWTRSHFFTASEQEKARVELLYSNVFEYEGIAFPVSVSNGPDKVAVHRFYSPSRRAHFYTSSDAEKQRVIDTMQGVYEYEGVGFYVTAAGFGIN